MSAGGEVKPSNTVKIVSVTEAAQTLGVSERTIYRRLKAGKMRRVNMSDSSDNIALKSQRNKRRDEILIEENQMSVEGVNMSDTMTDLTLETLQAQVREKDTQIKKLIEAQREMTQTVQRLQEQMYELARLVLTQNAGQVTGKESSEPKHKAEAGENAPSGFLSFFRHRDKK